MNQYTLTVSILTNTNCKEDVERGAVKALLDTDFITSVSDIRVELEECDANYGD